MSRSALQPEHPPKVTDLLIRHKDGRWSCAELCAQMLGMAEPWRQDPCLLHRVAQWAYAQHDAR